MGTSDIVGIPRGYDKCRVLSEQLVDLPHTDDVTCTYNKF